MRNKLLSVALTLFLAVLFIPGKATAQEQRARFRVTLTSFVVNHETVEGVIFRDGRGDEVYALVNSAELAPSNRILGSPQRRKSVIYGDTDGRAGAVRAIGIDLEHYPPHWMMKAGNAGPNGGLLSGNRYPDGPAPAVPADARPIDRGRFIPMMLWEGELRRGGTFPNAVVIIPTLWENDNIPDLLNVWNRQVDDYLRRFAANSARFINGTARRQLVEQVDEVLNTVPQRNEFDRPIGIDGDAFNPLAASPKPATFIPAVMLLTFDSAVNAANSTTQGSGVVEITYRDGERYGQGSYTIFLRVERLP